MYIYIKVPPQWSRCFGSTPELRQTAPCTVCWRRCLASLCSADCQCTCRRILLIVTVSFHDGRWKMEKWTCQSQTAALTLGVSCLVNCKSSDYLGGRARHICNKICGSFSLLWKKTKSSEVWQKQLQWDRVWRGTYIACLMTLDFSSRYSDILAPMTAPVGVNFISRYFPKRLELSLIAVQAFPKASTRGFTCKIFSRSVRLFAWERQHVSDFLTYLRFTSIKGRPSCNVPVYALTDVTRSPSKSIWCRLSCLTQ